MPAVRAVVKRRTLAAVGLALLALAATAPGFAAGQVAAAGGTPSAPEGPFAGNFTFSNPPPPAPSEAFQTLDGAVVALNDFRGQVVLVNFWATWCAPCVREMPSLERLHLQLAEEGLAVLAVSQDRNGAAVVTPFLGRIDLQHLPVYLDPKGALGRAFGVGDLPTTAGGLPTTYVVGRDGRVLAALVGPAEWDSPEAVAFLRHYLSQGPV